MPKLNLSSAVRIKNISGEIAILKGPGFLWQKLASFWRALFVSQDADSFTLEYTSGFEATETQASIADRGDYFTLDLPPAALVSQDADYFTIETDNL